MATSLGQAILTLRGDQRPLEGALQSAEKTTRTATSNMAQATRAVGVAFTAAGAAITGALGLSVRAAMTFQNAMAEVNTLGVNDLGALDAAIKSVAAEFGLELLDAVKATYQAISAGATEAQVPMLLAEAAKAATAGVSDLTTAIGLGTSVSNAFGSSITDVNKVFDQAFTAVKLGVTTFGELGSTLGQLSPIFSAAKLGTDEMFASVAALTKGGMQTSIAVTGMRTVVASVVKPSSDATKAAAELGIEFNTEALAAKGLQGFLQEVATATGGNVEAMSRLFPSVEALQAVLALTGAQAKDFDGTLKAMAGSAGATDEAFKRFTDGNDTFAWNQLTTSVQVLAVEIGEALLPVAKGLLDIVQPIIAKIIEWVRANPQLTQGLVIAAAAIGGIMLAVGPLLIALPGLVVAVGGVIGAFSGVGPVAMGVAAVIGVVLVAAWDYLVAAVKRAREWIERNWDQIVRIYKAASQVVTTVLKILGTFFKAWADAVGALFTGFAQGLGDAWDAASGSTKDGATTFLDALEGMLRWMNEDLPKILDWVQELANSVARNWKGVVEVTRWMTASTYRPLMEFGQMVLWVIQNLDRLLSNPAFEFLWAAWSGGGPPQRQRNIQPLQSGGIVRGPLQMVGERGPELARLPMGTRVYNARETQQMMGGMRVEGPLIGSLTVNGAQDAKGLSRDIAVELEIAIQDRFARRGLRLGTA